MPTLALEPSVRCQEMSSHCPSPLAEEVLEAASWLKPKIHRRLSQPLQDLAVVAPSLDSVAEGSNKLSQVLEAKALHLKV